MALGFPESSKEVEDRIKIDVAREAPDSNPYLRNSWLLALIVGFGRRIFDFYRDADRAIESKLPDKATGQDAEDWGAIYGVTKNPATQSTGNVVATGTATTVIPLATLLSANGLTYQSTLSATITASVISVSSITRSGTTATVTTVSDHGLASNVPVTIADAVETDYNVTDAAITATGTDTFTYQVANAPSTPATGTITAAFTSIQVPVESVDFGADTNLTLDTPMTLQSPIAGVDDVMNVDFGEISGGADQETDAELKTRYLEIIREPVAHFNTSDITKKAKEVPGVTRVFVEESGVDTGGTISITDLTRAGDVATAVTASAHGFDDGMVATTVGATEIEYNVTETPILVIDDTSFLYLVSGTPATPATGTPGTSGKIPLGVVRVLFTRDNDVNIIPSATEVQAVDDKLEEIRPANTSQSNMIVVAPIAVPVDFTFSSLSPNTSTMQAAIIDNLGQFFSEETVVGQDILEDVYKSVIQNTVDTETGDTISSFALSAPSGAVTINSGELGILGAVSF